MTWGSFSVTHFSLTDLAEGDPLTPCSMALGPAFAIAFYLMFVFVFGCVLIALILYDAACTGDRSKV